MDEPLAHQAMQRIQDHLETCSHNYAAMEHAFTQVRDSIKDLNRLIIGFIGGVFMVVITFAGYSYVQQQNLSTQLSQSRAANAAAVSQIPDLTVQKLTGAKP